MLHLRLYLIFHFKKHKKLQKNVEKKHAFEVAADGSLDNAITGVHL